MLKDSWLSTGGFKIRCKKRYKPQGPKIIVNQKRKTNSRRNCPKD